MLNATTEKCAESRGCETGDIKADIKKAAGKARAELRGLAHEAGRRSREMLDSAEHSVSGATDQLAGAIREKPFKSGFIALGIGVVLGMLVRRRSGTLCRSSTKYSI